MHALTSSVRMPRAIMSAISANADPKTMLANLQAAFVEFKSTYNGKHHDLEAAVDQLAVKLAAQGLGAGLSGGTPPDPEYTAQFGDFIRAGAREADLRAANGMGERAQIRASMSVGTAGDGGYLAPTEWDRTIAQQQLPTSPLRRLAFVRVTGVNAYTTLWNPRGFGTGWVGETAARPETAGTTFAPITFGHGEIYANPAVTQRLLDDADMKIEEFIGEELGGEFGRQEAITFVAGNGTNKPAGFLTYATGGVNAAAHPAGAIQVNTAASATVVAADELLTLLMNLAAPYRQNATWLMNSLTALALMKLKDGQGNYLWQQNVQAGLPSTLLGRPVEIDEGMPSVATGALPVAIGDFRAGYVINDRKGVRILRDPFTNKPFVSFYATKRVGGGVRDPFAFRVLKMA